jgi:hypothetical protein
MGSEGQVAHGKCVEYPTSTGKTNLDVEVAIRYKNGTYKPFIYLTPDGQQGKKEPMARFSEKEGEEVSLIRPNTIDDAEIVELSSTVAELATQPSPLL